LVLLALSASAADGPRVTDVTAGDDRFQPNTLGLAAGETLRRALTNTVGRTPHNFTLPAAAGAPRVDVGTGWISAIDHAAPSAGRDTFFSTRHLPGMNSHRERGIQGTLVVAPVVS
jgi:hypothetical protein